MSRWFVTHGAVDLRLLACPAAQKWDGLLPPLVLEARGLRWTLTGRRHLSAKGGDSVGHRPIIDVNPRSSVDMQEALKREKKARRKLGLVFLEESRYVVNSGSERIKGWLKDVFGGRHVRVRGYNKVLAHLTSGMTVLAASQPMRLIVPPI